MAGRPLAVSLVILALAAPAVAAAQDYPVEGTTVPVYEGQDPSLLPPPADQAPATTNGIPPTDPSAPFLEPLSQYGSWIALDGFGLVWQPDTRLVGATFTPYLTGGHWELTNVGWQFDSELPFAWAVYHYGRWLYDSEVGWVWAPDTEWGASWVDWQEAEGYVGWAPLPPAGYAYPAGYGPSYVFIAATYLTTYDLWPYLVSGPGVRRYVEMGQPCGYAAYGERTWPYGPQPGVLMGAGAAVPPAVMVSVPPAGHVYRGAVEVNVPPGAGSVPVRTPTGMAPAGSVVVNTPSVAVRTPGGLPGALPAPWRGGVPAVTPPRWGTSPMRASLPINTAPSALPGIHSVVTLPSRGVVAPRYVQQATAYGRPPPVPTWVSPTRGLPSAPMPGPSMASWGSPGVAAPAPVAAPSYGGYRAAPSFGGGGFAGGGGFGGGGFGGGVHVAAPAAPAPSFGGGFAGGGGGSFGGFRPSLPSAAPSYRPTPSFGGGGGGGGGFRGFGGGGFVGGGGAFRGGGGVHR